MSAISRSVFYQTSLLHRVHHVNTVRQALIPLSISARSLAESGNESTTERRSYDSVPVHLSSFGKLVMVLGGLYKRVGDVPDSLPNRVYQKTKDRFRARCVIASVFGTGLLSLVAAMRGKTAHKEGKRFTDSVYEMHRGESRLHKQLEAANKHHERYSPAVDEVNK